LKIVLITGLNNTFIAELIARFKDIKEIDFEHVIYWKREYDILTKLKRNLKKHGILYVPWRIIRFINDLFGKRIYGLVEKIFLGPQLDENLFSACSDCGINLYETNDIHSDEGIKFLGSLNSDVLVVCGTGILRRPVFSLPTIGTVNLHQGKVPEYRGAPPGFWEVWNQEKEVGVTIHFVNEGVDTGDVVLQELIPIFEYDDLHSIQIKLDEVSLSLYPEAVKQIAAGSYMRIKQPQNTGKQYFFPTLTQRVRLFFKIKKKQFSTFAFIKTIAKKVIFLLFLLLIWIRDSYLRKKGKNILSILYFHRVTNICKDGMTIDLEAFEKQIRFAKKHYHILSAEMISDWIETENEGDNLKGRKGILITFDDGYEDNFINALPILKRYSCPAIFFVSTGFIGNEKQFDHDSKLYPQLTFKKMSWEQLKCAASFGIELGIHTDKHADLGALSLEEAIKEIKTSTEKYQYHLGKKPFLMSYPFGGRENITKEIIDYIKKDKVITALFSAYGGKNISPIDKFNLKRINIGSNDIGLNFLLKIEGGFQTLFRPYEAGESVD
jgi:peptidoglycan/xylan/chitin deacetylase (PgdA/CDA1 family)/folate-dependent phosphoribosylglycinamide formyltransferase PurN